MPLEPAGFHRLVFLPVREPPALLSWLFWGFFCRTVICTWAGYPGDSEEHFCRMSQVCYMNWCNFPYILLAAPGWENAAQSSLQSPFQRQTGPRQSPKVSGGKHCRTAVCDHSELKHDFSKCIIFWPRKSATGFQKAACSLSGIVAQYHYHSINDRKRITLIFLKIIFTTVGLVQSLNFLGKYRVLALQGNVTVKWSKRKNSPKFC